MKKIFISFLLLAGIYLPEIQAQVKHVTIIDDLETFVPGEGIIQITSDPKITELIGNVLSETSASEKKNVSSSTTTSSSTSAPTPTSSTPASARANNSTSYAKISGYRILVFMSNDPKMVKTLTHKGNLIKGAFPDISVYTGYTAPNWKLLAGNFRTKEEADVAKQKLQRAIPELGKEMYVVPDKINIPLQ